MTSTFQFEFYYTFECKTLKIFALRLTKNIGMVSDKNVAKYLKVAKSHQHSYFELEVLAGLNQERES